MGMREVCCHPCVARRRLTEWILSDFSREKLEEAMLIFNKSKHMNYPTAVLFKKLIFNNLGNFSCVVAHLVQQKAGSLSQPALPTIW